MANNKNIDLFEYPTNILAQAAYVTDAYVDPASWDLLDEDCADISDWTDDDDTNGVSEVSPAGQFRMDANAHDLGGNRASRYRDIGTYPVGYSTFEIKLYHDALGTIAHADRFDITLDNGVKQLYLNFATDGLQYINNGVYVEIGTNIVAVGSWQTWRFVIDWATHTFDVYLGEVYQGSGIFHQNSTGYTNGYLKVRQYGYTTDDMLTHIDYIKLATGAYPALQCYSEATIKNHGAYSLKVFAAKTNSLNKTLTRTVSPVVNLTGQSQLKFDQKALRAGANIKIGIHDSGGTTTEVTHTQVADAFEAITADISAVANADKNAIDSIIITIVDADDDNIFYLDNMFGSTVPSDSATNYNIELRDKDGNLKTYLTPFASKVSWEWNRIGGCGRCSITINKAYRDIDFDARDDVQIRIGDVNISTNVYASNGNVDDEDMAVITDWNDGDAGGGESSQVTFDSKSCMKLDSGANTGNGKYALRSKDVGIFGARTVITISIYNDLIGTYANGDYLRLDIYNGTQEIALLFCSDGLYMYSAGDYNEVGVNLITLDTWQELTLDITWGIDVDIYLGEDLKATITNCFIDNITANGTIIFTQYGYTTAHQISYIDRFRAGNTFLPPIITATSKLVYRGYLANIVPTLKTNPDIVLDVRGYFDLLKKIVIQDTGDTKTYTTSKVSEIVNDIVDTFIVVNTNITEGTIEDGEYITDIDTIDFLGTVEDALRTLSEIAGDIEYGVDEDLAFYWMAEHTTISHKFFVGNNIAILERRVKWDDLVNKFYLIGGEVADAKYKKTGENTDSQSSYGLAEEIINNSSIVSDSVAVQYMAAILAEKAIPQFSIRATIKNTALRLEDTIPLGLVTFYDASYDSVSLGDLIGDIIGETADGGSDITIGETGDGGSGVIVGGQYSAQVDRISYSLSNTPGRFNLEIQLGDTVLETAAKIKRLERELASLTQY